LTPLQKAYLEKARREHAKRTQNKATEKVASYRIEYHPAQLKVLSEAKRFNVVVCGRRWGKSTLGIDLLVETALQGFPTGWFAPNYKLLKPVWDYAVRVLEPVMVRSNTTDRVIELRGGGIIEMWSMANNKNVGRSRKYKRVVIDESAMVAAMGDIWREAIRPTLADLEGDAWFLTTPKGDNFSRDVYVSGQDPFNKEWQSWRMPTATNPYIKSEEIEAAKNDPENSELAFRQEWLAEFVDNAGGTFSKVSAAAILKSLTLPVPEHLYMMGVDLAKKYDFSVCSILDTTDNTLYKQVSLDRFNKIDWYFQVARIYSLAKRFRVVRMVVDATGVGAGIVEQIKRYFDEQRIKDGLFDDWTPEIIAFEFNTKTKPQVIEGLVIAFERDEIQILDDVVQEAELKAYEKTVSSKTGHIQYNAPVGKHDDTVIGLALALHAALGYEGQNYRIRSLTDDDDTVKVGVGVTSIFSDVLGTTVEFDGEIWND